MPVKNLHPFKTLCESTSMSLAMFEDVFTGDITTEATVPPRHQSVGVFRAKSAGVVAGVKVVRQIFHAAKAKVKFIEYLKDGASVLAGEVIAEVTGSTAALLRCERTALNFMQRMSGIATRTAAFVDAVKHTRAKILDTRKTAPGLRFFDKDAVRIGGGVNHRIGLYDRVLIKDNHIDAAGGVSAAIQQAKTYCKANRLSVQIEVEVRSIDELHAALTESPDIIMLDNFSLAAMKKAVSVARQHQPDILLEASGGVSLVTVKKIAETGVDFISVGELTHSVTAMDISMKIVPLALSRR